MRVREVRVRVRVQVRVQVRFRCGKKSVLSVVQVRVLANELDDLIDVTRERRAANAVRRE